MEKTFAIIKPDAYKAGYAGKIIDAINEAGLKVAALKLVHLTKEQAGGFYAVHKDKPFFNDVCEFMSSGPCFVMVLAGDNAIKRWRELMGATNPEQADEGTLRKRFGPTSRTTPPTAPTPRRRPPLKWATSLTLLRSSAEQTTLTINLFGPGGLDCPSGPATS